jgi:hypothetical protein
MSEGMFAMKAQAEIDTVKQLPPDDLPMFGGGI